MSAEPSLSLADLERAFAQFAEHPFHRAIRTADEVTVQASQYIDGSQLYTLDPPTPAVLPRQPLLVLCSPENLELAKKVVREIRFPRASR